MKNTVILLALCALSMSCNQGARIARLEKERDSLASVLNNRKDEPFRGNISVGDTSLVDSSTVAMAMGNWAVISRPFNKNMAFIIPRDVIDSAFEYTDSCQGAMGKAATGLAVYLGYTQGAGVSIYWQPLYPFDINRRTNVAYLGQYVNINNNALLFDHTLPCPYCGIINSPYKTIGSEK